MAINGVVVAVGDGAANAFDCSECITVSRRQAYIARTIVRTPVTIANALCCPIFACPQYRLWRSFRWISVEIVGIFHMFGLWTLTPTRCNTIKEGIKMKLITIATVGTAIALIGFCGEVALELRWLFYPVLIAWLIGAAALIADIFRPDVRLRRWRFEN